MESNHIPFAVSVSCHCLSQFHMFTCMVGREVSLCIVHPVRGLPYFSSHESTMVKYTVGVNSQTWQLQECSMKILTAPLWLLLCVSNTNLCRNSPWLWFYVFWLTVIVWASNSAVIGNIASHEWPIKILTSTTWSPSCSDTMWSMVLKGELALPYQNHLPGVHFSIIQMLQIDDSE